MGRSLPFDEELRGAGVEEDEPGVIHRPGRVGKEGRVQRLAEPVRSQDVQAPVAQVRRGCGHRVEDALHAPAQTFTGDAWYDVIAAGQEPSRIRVNVVRFAPGARNAWHSHAAGQTLHVIDGIGLVQSRGGAVTEIRPGDTVCTPPGEWHWHGAAPGHFMTHLAMWESPGEGQGPETVWGDHVTDEEYNARPARGSARS